MTVAGGQEQMAGVLLHLLYDRCAEVNPALTIIAFGEVNR